MSLAAGTKLGAYEIVAPLGAGGMGEVYRAFDTKLQRDVAIKVLPSLRAGGHRRLARFEREARALAALNHPNIATVYGIEDTSDDPEHAHAIVMELIDGDDLSWRLTRGPLPILEALAVARQVADALAAAHAAGIVHRDLKPANIKVREDGTVKVLDFGLAKDAVSGSESVSESGSASGSASRSHSALVSPSASGPPSGSTADDLAQTLTLDGDVVGTPAYMAPEQARGGTVDKRADIWSFGVVLFEMLVGHTPFSGDDAAGTITRVLTTEPEWAALPTGTPSSIRRLLVRCLTKDRRQRLHDIADARLEIDEATTSQSSDQPSRAHANAADGPIRTWRNAMLFGMLGAAAGLAIGMAVWRAPRGERPVATHARVDVAPAVQLTAGGIHPTVVLPAAGARTALAWLPSGRTLAFIGMADGVRRIYVRDLGSDAGRPIAGTEGTRVFSVSPDGAEIAFWADGAVRKVKIGGGPPATICDAGVVNGITWGESRIVIVNAPALMEVSPSGGRPRQITNPTELVRHALPHLLPGDRALLYTEYEKQWTSGDERVMVLPLEPGGPPRVLLPNAADARYLRTGHLAFLRQGTLFIVPFDVRTLELRGEPVAVLKDVAQSVVAWDSDDLTLAGHYAISPQGMLAYVASPPASYPDRELVSLDRRGRMTSLGAPVKGYRNHIELSPDGTRLAVSIQTGTDVRLFAYDLRRGSLSRIGDALNGEAIVAAWSRDDRLAVQLIDAGKITAVIVRPDGAGAVTSVAESTGFWASSWSVDGRLVGMKGGRLWIYRPDDRQARPREVAATRAHETQPTWSPDGRWIAYTSNTTGRVEVYVRSVAGTGDAIAVSTGGGSSPAWNPNGRELFFIEAGPDQDRMMSAVMTTPEHPSKPLPLFSFSRDDLYLGASVLTPYVVSPDGQRFYAVKQLPRITRPITEISVILNWFDELSAKLTRPGRAQ